MASASPKEMLSRLRDVPEGLSSRTDGLFEDVRTRMDDLKQAIDGRPLTPSHEEPEPSRVVEVIPQGLGWAIRRPGSTEIDRIFSSRGAAITVAKEAARREGCKMAIYDEEGTLERIDGTRPDERR